jgi:hypothetical protein
MALLSTHYIHTCQHLYNISLLSEETDWDKTLGLQYFHLCKLFHVSLLSVNALLLIKLKYLVPEPILLQ